MVSFQSAKDGGFAKCSVLDGGSSVATSSGDENFDTILLKSFAREIHKSNVLNNCLKREKRW